MSTPNPSVALSRNTRDVYIIRLKGTSSRLSAIQRGSRDAAFSWALLVLPMNNDGGVVWFIPTSRQTGRPSWTRVELKVNRESSHLTQLGKSTRSDTWINHLANQVVGDLSVNHDNESSRELILLFCQMLGDLLLGETTIQSSGSLTRDASKSAQRHVCGTFEGQCGAESCPSAPFHNTESRDTECMVIKPDGTVTIGEDEQTPNAISGSSDILKSTDDAESDADPESSEDDEDTSSEYMETASQTSESTDASDEETNDDEATPSSDSTGTYRRYRKVQVFMISWETHDLDNDNIPSLDKEIADIVTAFESFGYNVDRFLIPKFKPTESLRNFLKYEMQSCMTEYWDDETLIIVWYGGHGGIKEGGDRGLILTSHDMQIAWKDIYESFLEVNSDLLIFLHCCHAGASVLSEEQLKPFKNHNKRFIKEVFCASGFDTTTCCGADYSLAPTFIDILGRHRETADLNTSSLERQMIHSMKGHYKKGWNLSSSSYINNDSHITQEPAPTSNTPLKIEMTSGRPGAILLHPLPDPEAMKRLKRPFSFVFSDDEDEDDDDDDDEPPKRRRKMNG